MKLSPAKSKRKLLAVLVSAAMLAAPAIPRAESHTLRFAPLSDRSSPSPLYFDIPLATGESLTDIRLVADNGSETSLLSLFDLQASASGVSAQFRQPIDFSAYYGTSFTLRLLKTGAANASSEDWLRLLVVSPDELAQDLRLVAVTDGSPQPDAIAFVVPGAVNATLDDIQVIDNGQPVSIQSLLDLSARRDGGMQAELRSVDLDGMSGRDIELRAQMTIQPHAMPIARKLLLTPIRRTALTQDTTVDIATSGDNRPDALTLALANSANIEVQDIALDNDASLMGLFTLTRAADGALSATPKTAIDFDAHIGAPIALQVRKAVAGATYTQKITLVAQLPQPRLTAATDGTLAIDGRVAQGNAIRELRYVLYADAAGTAEVARAATGAFADLIADNEYHVGTVATAGDSTPLKSPLLATRTLPADPDAFVFGTANNLARNSVVASSPVTITGILGRAAVGIIGGEYSIDNGAWTAAAGLVRNGQTLRVRGTTAHSYATASSVTLTVGTRSASFRLTTASEPDTTPDAFSFTDVAGQVLSTMVESNAIAVAGINAATSISVAGGEYQIDGNTWTSAAGTVTNGQTVKVRHTTSATNSTATNTTLTMGGVSGTFTTTTAAPVVDTPPVADTTPNAFTFTDVTDQTISTVVESNAITVSGIDAATAISVTDGEYQINGGAWTSSAGTVTNGQTVKVHHTTSGSNSTATNTTLAIGGVSDTFTTTTVASSEVPPTLGDVPNQTATVGLAFSLALAGHVTQTNGDAITLYEIASGSLPAGLSLNTGTGEISGTPTTVGTSNITVRAQDNDGWSSTDAIQFVVSNDTTAPATPSIALSDGDASNGTGISGYTNSVHFNVSITDDTDDVGVVGWYVSGSSTTPVLGDFSGTRPTSYDWPTMSADGNNKTLYVWTRDAAGNISSPGSGSINLGRVGAYNAYWSGTVPDTQGASYNGLILVGNQYGFADAQALTVTASAGTVSGVTIDGSGLVFNWTTPNVASATLTISGTDRYGNTLLIDRVVNLPN